MRIAIMSLTVFAAAALSDSNSNVASAQVATTYPWCMQPVGTWGPDCSYATIAQCRATAEGVGFCYENPAFTAARRPPQMRR